MPGLLDPVGFRRMWKRVVDSQPKDGCCDESLQHPGLLRGLKDRKITYCSVSEPMGAG
jgi:hypothetical protein